MNPIEDGDRIKVDGELGTVIEGWDGGDRWYINVRLDNGGPACVVSGSPRIERLS